MIAKARLSATSILLSCVVTLAAQPQQPAPSTPHYAFDVVSIKPHAPGDTSTRIDTTRDHFSGSNISLRALLAFAYDLDTEDLVSGIPKPLDAARFDIVAKMDADTNAAFKKLSREDFRRQQQSMFIDMLQDRFQLKVHRESKEHPVYRLVVAKGGLKCKRADPNDTYPNGLKGPDGTSHAGTSSLRNGDWTAQGVPMKTLVVILQQQPDVHRVIVDGTGLAGTYDFELRWSPGNTVGSADSGATDAGPSLFAALEEQLGLKLEPAKAFVQSVVVDAVTAPSEN